MQSALLRLEPDNGENASPFLCLEDLRAGVDIAMPPHERGVKVERQEAESLFWDRGAPFLLSVLYPYFFGGAA